MSQETAVVLSMFRNITISIEVDYVVEFQTTWEKRQGATDLSRPDLNLRVSLFGLARQLQQLRASQHQCDHHHQQQHRDSTERRIPPCPTDTSALDQKPTTVAETLSQPQMSPQSRPPREHCGT